MESEGYKGYLIEPESRELQQGGWQPYAVVVLNRKDSLTTTPLSASNTKYATREEADAHAITMAKKWIDEHG